MTYVSGIESHLIRQIRRDFLKVNKASKRKISMAERPQKFSKPPTNRVLHKNGYNVHKNALHL